MSEQIKKTQAHYDKMYAEGQKVFGRGQAEPTIVERIPEFATSGKVLDIGAGQGRNALFLARNGFQVTAIDLSSVGLAQIEEAAHLHRLQVSTLLASVGDDELPIENANVVIFSFMLHHVEDEKVRSVIAEFKKRAPVGALHAIMAFTTNGDFYRNRKSQKFFYPKPGELKSMYADWEILIEKEKVTTAQEEREDGTPMENLTTFLLVRKLLK
jgi:tellurite methyltransferase